MVATLNGNKVVRCPVCRGMAEFEDDVPEDGIVGLNCPHCGYLAWPYWVDEEK